MYLVFFTVFAAGGWWYYSLQNYPQQRTLWTADGKTIHADIVGRTDTLFKYLQDSDEDAYYVPIVTLSKVDQWMTKLMPVNMEISYPVDCKLQDADGRTVKARIVGRSNDEVNFMMGNKSAVFTYPLAKLSPQDQAWIGLLAVSQPDLPVTSPATAAPQPPEVKVMEEEIAQLQQDILNTRSWMTDPIVGNLQRAIYEHRILDETAEIEHLQITIDAMQSAAQH